MLPASFILTEGFDDIAERPFTSGGFADVYKATYKGQSVVVKALKTTSLDRLESIHKVCGPNLSTIAQSAHDGSSALCRGGRSMEMAST